MSGFPFSVGTSTHVVPLSLQAERELRSAFRPQPAHRAESPLGCILDASRSQSTALGKRDLYVYATERAVRADDGNVGHKTVVGIPSRRYLRHAAAKLLDLWYRCQAGQYDAENECDTTEKSCDTASSASISLYVTSGHAVAVETTRIFRFGVRPWCTSA